MKINQTQLLEIINKPVEWLVDNSYISKFDPKEMKGYQREIDEKHCKKIIEYIEKNNGFYFPSAIVAASDDKEMSKLRIVDGQHRIEAFRIIKENKTDLYNKIKNFELPVIVLVDPNEEVEMETFITINKTSKKVDTSLATVLKTRIDGSDDRKSKIAYLSVETAYNLNYNHNEFENEDTKKSKSLKIWENRIAFEGPTRNTRYIITLNAFVREISRLVSILQNKGVLSFEWQQEGIVEMDLEIFNNIFLLIWNEVIRKWPKLFNDASIDSRQIIQGGIGLGAISRVVTKEIKDKVDNDSNYDDVEILILNIFKSISLPFEVWLPDNEKSFARYSSGSGYAFVASELLNNMRANGYR